jgi:hypothetical protein
VRTIALFFIVGLGGGMILGARVGKSGMETESYVKDINQYVETGDRISQARNGARRTLEGQLAMYQQIEPDVIALKALVERLISENSEYAAKYPAARSTTAKSGANFENTSKRAELLLQQIAVAKEIRSLPDQDSQRALYREKMTPILEAEERLDGH